MKINICALMLSLWLGLAGIPIGGGAQQLAAEKQKLTAEERKKLLAEKKAERKRLQKEREALAKQKKKEKLLAQKQKEKEKKEQQKELLRLKKERLALKNTARKANEKASDQLASVPKASEPKRESLTRKVQPAKQSLTASEKKIEPTQKAKQSQADFLVQQKPQKSKEDSKPKENIKESVRVHDLSTQASRDSIRAARKERARIVALPYDVPSKEFQHESFVKYGKLHQFQVKGLNARLYDVFVNGENYTQNSGFDTSIVSLYANVKAQPLESKKADLSVSLIENEPWLSFFRAEDYRSSIPRSAYRNYIDKFNEIKAELKKQALSYKDFVGVLEVGENNRRLPMQYELLDTTFYKSYYLLFVSRVDLLKDYHNAFVNQVANLDTVRYAEVLRYKKKVEQGVRTFVSAKQSIDLALDSLQGYVRALDEFYQGVFTDPVAYEGAELEAQKQHFLSAFNLPIPVDSAGVSEVRAAIRAKILAQKKRIVTALGQAGDAYKSLEAYILQSRDYVDIYRKKYEDVAQALDKMDDFVNKELSLQDRNIRLSEIVENLYRRLMLEYEVMRNQVKDNITNMVAKASDYGNFLNGTMSYARLRTDYEKLRSSLGNYLQDAIYDKLALLIEKIFVSTNDANNFVVEAKVQRIQSTDFVDYNLLVQPKKNLPKQMLPKFTPIRETFRLPVYGGFIHSVGLSLGVNLSLTPSYKLEPVANQADNYTIAQDGSSTKAKFHLGVAYNFLYRTKNPNFRYGGNAGLLLDLTNLLHPENTKVLLGPAFQFYDRLLLSAGITLGAEPTLKSEYSPGQVISIRSNLNGNPNNVLQQLHNNRFALGIYFSAGVSLF